MLPIRLSSIKEPSITEATDLTFSVALDIEGAPADVWAGKLATAETHVAFAGRGLLPKDQYARSLLKVWNAAARGDGKVPGALIGLLADSVRTFTKSNPASEATPRLLQMLPRFDATRDWSGPEAAALLDELAALKTLPIEMALDHEREQTIRTGAPLPPELAGAPWGKPLPCGLRMAWLLEPRAAGHRLGTPLKSRILFHNAGKGSVVFRTRTWHQVEHAARDADGAAVPMTSVTRTTLAPLVPFRLAPGEFVEVSGAGIGVGANTNSEDWQNTSVASWVEAKAGDQVTFTSGPVPICDWGEEPPAGDGPQDGDGTRWWLDFITARLARLRPLPADAAERKRLLVLVADELFGAPPIVEETIPFVRDRRRAALDTLAKRLARHPGLMACSGSLTFRPDGIPRLTRRSRRRETPAHREQPGPLHAGRERPAGCHSPPGWRAVGERSEYPLPVLRPGQAGARRDVRAQAPRRLRHLGRRLGPRRGGVVAAAGKRCSPLRLLKPRQGQGGSRGTRPRAGGNPRGPARVGHRAEACPETRPARRFTSRPHGLGPGDG